MPSNRASPADGIVVREVLLRDIQLPAEYAQGLEGLLLKEQENERLGTEQEIKQKQVRIAELEADAQKARDVKQSGSSSAGPRTAGQGRIRLHAIHSATQSKSRSNNPSSKPRRARKPPCRTPKPPLRPKSSIAKPKLSARKTSPTPKPIASASRPMPTPTASALPPLPTRNA